MTAPPDDGHQWSQTCDVCSRTEAAGPYCTRCTTPSKASWFFQRETPRPRRDNVGGGRGSVSPPSTAP